MRETAACVAAHMEPSDVLVATEWNWAGYLPYLHQRNVVSLIAAIPAAGGTDAGLASAAANIRETERNGGVAYVLDPASYPPAHVDWVEAQVGLDLEDLESFAGDPAFECGNDRFRTLARGTRLSP
jgi:hypothetical protein